MPKQPTTPVNSDTEEEIKLTYLDKLILHLNLKSTDKMFGEIKKFEEKQNELRSANSSKLQFGKYKGKSFKDILAFDRKYLEWLIKQDWMSERTEYETINKLLQ